MKFVITVVASKEVTEKELYAYQSKKIVNPKKSELYMAIQEYLGSNGYQVSELSVKEADDFTDE